MLYSTLETVPIASADRRVAYVARAHFEAPNWSRDGSYFLFNQDGGIYRLALSSRIHTMMFLSLYPLRRAACLHYPRQIGWALI